MGMSISGLWMKAAVANAFTLAAAGAFAGSLVLKPGAQDTFAPEFGSAIARSGNYTAVGAMQETIALPGEPIFGGGFIGAQGAVYLYNGTSATPERIYQFPGNQHFQKKAGAKVALSSKWLAFFAPEFTTTEPKVSAVFIVGKTNSQWTQCPTVNAQVNCNALVGDIGVSPAPAILRIPLIDRRDVDQVSIAISDNYLLIGDAVTSQVKIYRHDATLNRWVPEQTLDEVPDAHLGTAVAIDGNRIAVGAPYRKWGDWEAPTNKGWVKIYSRNSTTKTWNLSATASGSFSAGAFGRALDMHSGNLVVSAGLFDGPQHLAFYRLNSDGSLTAPYYFTTPAPVEHMSLYGDTLVASANGDLHRALDVYKRDPSNITNPWYLSQTLDGYLYASALSEGNAYPGIDPMELDGDNLVLGWRAYNGFRGAFIHEKISLIDTCKNPLNRVANCSFDNSSGAGWQFLNHQGASAWASFSGSQLTATISNPGFDHWHIQARTPIKLTAGASATYQLRFRAKAPNFRDLTVNIGHNGNQDNNWVSYGRTTFRPGPEWTTYIYEFYGVPSDANAFLDFNLGAAGTTGITIDSVSLTPLD